MNLFTAIFLGIIQGLTEFLPVSSSGHLVLFQKIIPGFHQPGVLFDVTLHFGTLCAVFYFYRRKIFSASFSYLYLLAISTLPAFVFGFLFKDQFESMFKNPKFLGLEFVVTAIICFLIDVPTKTKSKLNTKNSLLIGLAQAVSIVPAISRSGATIFAGVKAGINKKQAAEFSFLMSIPAILGANMLEVWSYGETFKLEYLDEYIVGFATSFLVGFVTIRILLTMLVTQKFKYFGAYALLLGIIVILFF